MYNQLRRKYTHNRKFDANDKWQPSTRFYSSHISPNTIYHYFYRLSFLSGSYSSPPEAHYELIICARTSDSSSRVSAPDTCSLLRHSTYDLYISGVNERKRLHTHIQRYQSTSSHPLHRTDILTLTEIISYICVYRDT